MEEDILERTFFAEKAVMVEILPEKKTGHPLMLGDALDKVIFRKPVRSEA